jgi:hypothetical protein
MSSVSTVVSGHPALVPSPISNGIAKVAGDVQAFHVYHLSKTGGSTLMNLLSPDNRNGLLTEKGQDMFTGQNENCCNKKNVRLLEQILQEMLYSAKYNLHSRHHVRNNLLTSKSNPGS